MPTDAAFVTHVLDQFDPRLGATAKKMFGEYGVFAGGKMFALVCDDRLLFKPTASGRAHIGTPVEAEPYAGAKPCFLIESELDDREWLTRLAECTLPELPVPKARKKTVKKTDLTTVRKAGRVSGKVR